MAKKRIAVLFGGVSSEHEISLLSAAAVLENLPPNKYDVVRLGITKNGRWLLYNSENTDKIRDGSWHQSDCLPAALTPDRATHGIVVTHENQLEYLHIDAVFPVLHGRNGEDGTVQGLLELSGIPYVGCGVLASAMCMDKAVANEIFDARGIPHTPWMAAHRNELGDFDELMFRLGSRMRFPIFVKPSVGGSSVGVTKVKTVDELRDAMKLASMHDEKIVFEQAVEGREVECAVLGNTDLFGTLPGEIQSCNEIYDYEAKYQSGDASRLFIPARLPQEKLEEARDMALQAYAALGCTGLARVDFFVEQDSGRVLLNEINTMPGFTAISMYPKLMEASGIPFAELLDKLIGLAFERAEV